MAKELSRTTPEGFINDDGTNLTRVTPDGVIQRTDWNTPPSQTLNIGILFHHIRMQRKT